MNPVAVMGPTPGSVISRPIPGSAFAAAANRASAALSFSVTRSMTRQRGAIAVAVVGDRSKAFSRRTKVSVAPLRTRRPSARVMARETALRRGIAMGVALRADGAVGERPGQWPQVAGRRRSAAMAAKVVVQPGARVADASRPPRRPREQRKCAWRTSLRLSRRIQNGRTRPDAGGVVDRLHVACLAAGTLAQGAAGQFLIGSAQK